MECSVQPITVNELLIGIAETYDIIFQMPHAMKTFEAKATAHDITGSAVMRFGMGELERVPKKMKPSPYGVGHGNMNIGDMDHENMDHENMNHGNMNHGNMDHGNMNHGNMGHNDESPKVGPLNYRMLRSKETNPIFRQPY